MNGLCVVGALVFAYLVYLLDLHRMTARALVAAYLAVTNPANLRRWCRTVGPFVFLAAASMTIWLIDYPSTEMRVTSLVLATPLLIVCTWLQWNVARERLEQERRAQLFDAISGYGFDPEHAGIVDRRQAVLAVEPGSGTVGLFHRYLGLRTYDGRSIKGVDWIRNGLMFLSTDASFDAQSFSHVEDAEVSRGIYIRLHFDDSRTPTQSFQMLSSEDALYWFKRFRLLISRFSQDSYVDAWHADADLHRAETESSH